MTTIERWNDDRLDDLQYRVSRVETSAQAIGVLGERVDSLTREVRANTEAQQVVSKQIEASNVAPLERGRAFRSQLYIALAAALAGAGVAVIATLLGSAH